MLRLSLAGNGTTQADPSRNPETPSARTRFWWATTVSTPTPDKRPKPGESFARRLVQPRRVFAAHCWPRVDAQLVEQLVEHPVRPGQPHTEPDHGRASDRLISLNKPMRHLSSSRSLAARASAACSTAWARSAASLRRSCAWKGRVEAEWGDVAVVDVKTSAMRGWVSKMAANDVGAPTIENALGLLRQVLGTAVEDRRIPRKPCEGVRLPERKHADRGYLGHAQVAALAGAVDRHGHVVRFLAYAGRRWGEMAALRVQDFDMLRRRVNVSRSVTESGGLVWSTPKTHERRSVPFPAVLADETGGAHGRKGPRRHGVHRYARRGAAQLQLPRPGV